MAIEARGGKDAYVYTLSASHTRTTGDDVITRRTTRMHTTGFDTADSEDEAYGRAMRMAKKVFPESLLWTNHHAVLTKISDIAWVSRANMDEIKPIDPPKV